MIRRRLGAALAAVKQRLLTWALDTDLMDHLTAQERAALRAADRLETGNVLRDSYYGSRPPKRGPHVR